MKPKAFLFDLDGSLIDSEPAHHHAEILAFREFGLVLTPADLVPYMGTTLAIMLMRVRDDFGLSVTSEEFLTIEQPILTKLIREEVTVFEDALRLLDRISRAKLALVTSSSPWYVDTVLAKFPEVGARFPIRVTGADVVNGKPHPEPFLMACEELGVEPSFAVAIEDSPNGVRSAKAAGCFVVGIDRERHGRLSEASVVVASLDDFRW